MKQIPIAICYDFDGTLSPGNMQEYGFVKQLGMENQTFWKKSNALSEKQNADHILSYMRQMKFESEKKGIPFNKKRLQSYGQDVALFPGLDDWFKRINTYGRKKGLRVEHYIISSGLKEILEGISIAKSFKEIFASSFMYGPDGNVIWPALAVNYTNKTQFLFRINKGCFDVSDDVKINQRIPEAERYMPFSRMIYIGDGETDVPCMQMLKNDGGHSIAVYQCDKADSVETARTLLSDGRVDFTAPADYRANQPVEQYVKALIDKIAVDVQVQKLKNQ